MRIGDIVDRLNRKEPLTAVAKKLGITPYALSKKLSMLGYEYDSEKKRRVFVGEGEEPRERSIFDDSKPSVHTSNYEELMYKELRAIRALLEQRGQEPLIDIESKRVKCSFSLPEPLIVCLARAAKERGMHKSRIMECALRRWLQENG